MAFKAQILTFYFSSFIPASVFLTVYSSSYLFTPFPKCYHMWSSCPHTYYYLCIRWFVIANHLMNNDNISTLNSSFSLYRKSFLTTLPLLFSFIPLSTPFVLLSEIRYSWTKPKGGKIKGREWG